MESSGIKNYHEDEFSLESNQSPKYGVVWNKEHGKYYRERGRGGRNGLYRNSTSRFFQQNVNVYTQEQDIEHSHSYRGRGSYSHRGRGSFTHRNATTTQTRYEESMCESRSEPRYGLGFVSESEHDYNHIQSQKQESHVEKTKSETAFYESLYKFVQEQITQCKLSHEKFNSRTFDNIYKNICKKYPHLNGKITYAQAVSLDELLNSKKNVVRGYWLNSMGRPAEGDIIRLHYRYEESVQDDELFKVINRGIFTFGVKRISRDEEEDDDENNDIQTIDVGKKNYNAKSILESGRKIFESLQHFIKECPHFSNDPRVLRVYIFNNFKELFKTQYITFTDAQIIDEYFCGRKGDHWRYIHNKHPNSEIENINVIDDISGNLINSNVVFDGIFTIGV